MGEALGKIPKGDTSWVYVGSSKKDYAKKKEVSKADTEFNTFLQQILDVADPIVKKEHEDVVEINGKIALAAAEELNKKNKAWKDFKEHKDLKRYLLEQDIEWRGRDVPKRLERMLVFGLIGSGAVGLDMGTDNIAKTAFSRIKDKGNQAALTKGWEMLTDLLSGNLFDAGARWGTNKKDIGYITPVSSAFGQVGNTILTMVNNKSKIWNSLVNPGAIESGFRAIGAIPWVGVIPEKIYAAANRELLEQDGMFPFIFNMAFNMMLEKETHKDSQEQSLQANKKKKYKSHSGGRPLP